MTAPPAPVVVRLRRRRVVASATVEPAGANDTEGTVLEGLRRLRAAAADGRLDELAERLGIGLLGVFGSAVRPGCATPPGDLDVAVRFRGPPRELALLDALTLLTGTERIDLLRLEAAEPVARAEAMVGVGLYESTAGAWAIEQMAALAERRDTAHLRVLDRHALGR